MQEPTVTLSNGTTIYQATVWLYFDLLLRGYRIDFTDDGRIAISGGPEPLNPTTREFAESLEGELLALSNEPIEFDVAAFERALRQQLGLNA